MANFIKDLGKGFVRSAVNQVGRDYGKTISNQIFGDAHATPIRMIKADKSTVLSRVGQPNANNEIQYHKQDIINWQDIACLIVSPLLPVVGTVVYGIFTLIYLFSSKTRFIAYTNAPQYVSDRRCKNGYRLESAGTHKELIEIPNIYVDKKTIAKGKIRAGVWLLATIISTIVTVYLLKTI